MKTLRYFAVLMFVLLATVAVNAQTALQGKFRLTEDVRWGKAVLPAGEYSFVIDSMQKPIRVVVQSVDGKVGMLAATSATADASPSGSYIFVTGTGKKRLVRSMNLPQVGRALIYVPLTQRERETLYSSVSQTVPVEVAKK
jgi:hypothetical protein